MHAWISFFPYSWTNIQQVKTWWLGSGGLDIWDPLMKRDCYLGVPPRIPKHRAPNHQFTIGWNMSCPPSPEGSKLGISHVPGTGDLASLTFVVLPTRLVGWECVWLFLSRDTAIASILRFQSVMSRKSLPPEFLFAKRLCRAWCRWKEHLLPMWMQASHDSLWCNPMVLHFWV